MKLHPLCEIFPVMDDERLQELAADIKANGQRAAIITLDDMILDGQNRYQACLIAEVEPKFRKYDGKDPVGFVESMNCNRRDLTKKQVIGLRLELSKFRNNGSIQSIPLKEIAKESNSSEVYVKKISAAMNKATPKQRKDFTHGKLTVQELEKPKEKQTTKAAESAIKDDWLYPVPETILESWNWAKEFSAYALKELSNIACEMEKARAFPGMTKLEHDIANARLLRSGVKNIIPHSICPHCQGLRPKGCKRCGERGWINKESYKCTEPEIKKFWERLVK